VSIFYQEQCISIRKWQIFVKNMATEFLCSPCNAARRMALTSMIGVLLIAPFLAFPIQTQTASVKPFTPHEVKVLVVSPNQLYHNGAGLLISDLASFGFNITYHASETSLNPDYLNDNKTAQLNQYDVVILHGILGYPPSKVSVEELAHFTDYGGTLVVIGNALFTNETSGQFWENTFTSAPILKLEQRLGVDFTGYLTTPFHNNGIFSLVDRSIKGLPESLSYTTMYNQSINSQFAITLTTASEVYNFTTQSGLTTAGVTFDRNSTTGAVGIYIQGSYIYAEEVPISSRKIRYFGLGDTNSRTSLLGSLIAFSLGVDVETVIKPQPLATIRLDGLGERAFNDEYLKASLANFNAVVDKYGIGPTVAFTEFNNLYPEYWQKVASNTLSQLRAQYRDWEYSSSLRNENLTSMAQSELRTLLQDIKSNFTSLEMDLFSTCATVAGLWNQATLEAMANENLSLLDSAREHATLVKDYSEWWNLSVSSSVVLHTGVRMGDKRIENFTQFGYSQDYLYYLYFSMRDRLALSVVNGFPSLVYGVSNFRWDQVGTYSVETVYKNLSAEIPDISFVPLVEGALYFGNKWIRIENPVRDGLMIDFDLNASAIPDVASIGKGMVWLRINSAESIGGVTIDSQPWFYFDDHSIRLPAGSVHVRVSLGQPTTPSVIRTAHKVITTSWDTQNFVVTVSATTGLNVTLKMLIPQISPFASYWTVYCSEAQRNWGYAFDDSTRVLSFWAISDGAVTFSAGADVIPPLIGKISCSPTVYSANVKVKAEIKDLGSGIKNAILSYSVVGGGWINVTMVLEGNAYVESIPAFPFGTAVAFKVFGEDNAGNWQVSSLYIYKVLDRTPPSVGVPEWSPLAPSSDQSVLVRVAASEPAAASGVRYVKLYYSLDNKMFTPVTMTGENDTWQGSIPPRNSSGTVYFYVQAFDKAGNSMKSPGYSYTVSGMSLPPLPIIVAAVVLVGVMITIFFFVKVRKPRKKASDLAKKRR